MSFEAGAITVRTVGALLIATWPRRIILGTLMLIPVIVAVLGGFTRAVPDARPVAAGETVDLGPLTISPTAFFISDEVYRSGLEFGPDGTEAWIGVIVQVENVTQEQIPLAFPGAGSDAIRPTLPGGQLLEPEATTPDTVLIVSDATDGSTLLPGIPLEVAMLWHISDPETIGNEISATMIESVWTYGVLSGEDKWLSLGDTWQVSLPRTELPPTLYEPLEAD